MSRDIKKSFSEYKVVNYVDWTHLDHNMLLNVKENKTFKESNSESISLHALV